MIDFDSLVIGPCISTFGTPATYTSPAAGLIQITGVFDEAYVELTPMGRGGFGAEAFSYGSPGAITTEMPVLGVQLSQFPPNAQPAQGDLLALRGTTYAVKEVRPDGHGGAKLLLNAP